VPIETRDRGLDPRERQGRAPSTAQESPASAYQRVRATSTRYCKPLSTEDFVVQSMPDVSPTKWHLAHTSWFFETFILQKFLKGYRPFCPDYAVLFNSYYNAVGEQFPRPRRGLLSRPTVEEVLRYREYVDRHVLELLESCAGDSSAEMSSLLTLGLHHEQQHQELMLTDIKHVFSCNPLRPVYMERKAESSTAVASLGWTPRAGGLHSIGHDGNGFAYDNETPRHQVFVHPYRLATRLVTNGEYMAFVADDGYARPELWLSDGWAMRQTEEWSAPLYWERRDDRWWYMTLAGMREVDADAPVCHVSYFEADAFARWRGVRLPTEAEWETVAEAVPCEGNFADDEHFHPIPAFESQFQKRNQGATGGSPASDGWPPSSDSEIGSATISRIAQTFGDVWEWTGSPYVAYPGYRPAAGAVGEYNGKFMCQQYVLRGGSCATGRSHIRPTYRNFFPPQARWQFSGIRLAADPD